MNVFNVWWALPAQKRILSLLSVIATLAFVYVLSSIALKPKLDLLYSGLDPASAGEVIAKLDTIGVSYEVRGDAIFADAGRRDSLRLELAREGLPRQSVVGYELFDNLNSFAMSSEMFDTAYWRAKEGELARTLLSLPNVKAARVHLGAQKATGFRVGQRASTASVTLSTSTGINAEQAKAIQYVTALAVVGLSPEDVAVIDTVRGLVAGPGLQEPLSAGGSGEIERAAQLKDSLVSMLEARVGPGNARVNVSLDLDRTRESSTERTYDPDGRVLKSQTTSENSGTSSGNSSNVTVASNLPEGAAGGGETTSETTDTTETVTYEISEILRNREVAPGAVKRMTIAVLVSDIETLGEDGALTTSPRDAAEMEILTELVTLAAGVDADRGDQITVKSLAFDRPVTTDMVEKMGVMDQFKEQYLWSTLQSGILALVILILGLFVVRPLLSPRENILTGDMPELLPMASPVRGALKAPDATAPAAQVDGSVPALGQAASPLLIGGPTANSPLEALNSTAAENPEDAADLLASWLAQETQGAA